MTHRVAARASFVGVAFLILVLALLGGPASAIGAQGVELTPLLSRQGPQNRLTAQVGEEVDPIRIQLDNTTDEPRTITVYAAESVTPVGGGTGVGPPADWVDVDIESPLTLAPGESITVDATVDPQEFREREAEEILFLLEVAGAGNIVPRAATIVALVDVPGEIVLSRGLIPLAALLLFIVTAACVAVVQRQGIKPTAQPSRVSG